MGSKHEAVLASDGKRQLPLYQVGGGEDGVECKYIERSYGRKQRAFAAGDFGFLCEVEDMQSRRLELEL